MSKVKLPPRTSGICIMCNSFTDLVRLEVVQGNECIGYCNFCGAINYLTVRRILDNSKVMRCGGCGAWVHETTMCVTCEVVRKRNVSYTRTS